MANNTNLSFPSAFYQQFFKDGKPLAGGKLYSYIAGSSTPVVTYKTISGGTESANMNTNPIILDMNGMAELVISTDTAYKFILFDRNNAKINEWDNVTAGGSEGGGSSEDIVVVGTTNEINVSENVTQGVKRYVVSLSNSVKNAILYLFGLYENVVNSLDNKADKVQGATSGDLAALDANGNLTDSDYKVSDFKTKQTAVPDPSASGSGLEFISSVSQNANGEVATSKKSVQDGTTSQKGVVKLNNAINSSSTTEAATPKAVKDAYDSLNNKIIARATFLSQEEWAVQSQLQGDPAKVYYVENGTGEDAFIVYVWNTDTNSYVEVDESSISLDGYWHDAPTTTGDGNVVTSITLGNNGVPQVVKGITALTQHQDISGKLDKNGDASNTTSTFTIASSRTNISSGEKLSTIFGKIAKWFSDLKAVAFSGSYSDLSDKPTIPAAANNGVLTIKQNGTSNGTFSANQSSDTEINLTDTTYESKSAESGGTAVSLVTTGEKYAWNAKQNALPTSGTPSSTFAINVSGTAKSVAVDTIGTSASTWLELGTFKFNQNVAMFAGLTLSVEFRSNDARSESGFLWVSAGEWKASGDYTNDDIIIEYYTLGRRDQNKTTNVAFYAKSLGTSSTSGVKLYAKLEGNSTIFVAPVNAIQGSYTPLMIYLDSEPTGMKEAKYSHLLRTENGTAVGSQMVPVFVNSYGQVQECTPANMSVGSSVIANYLKRAYVNKSSQTTKIWKKIATSKTFTTWDAGSICFLYNHSGYINELGLDSIVSVSIRTGNTGSFAAARIDTYSYRSASETQLVRIGSTNQYEVWAKVPTTDTNMFATILNSYGGWTINTDESQTGQLTDDEFTAYKSSNPSIGTDYNYNLALASKVGVGSSRLPIYAKSDGTLSPMNIDEYYCWSQPQVQWTDEKEAAIFDIENQCNNECLGSVKRINLTSSHPSICKLHVRLPEISNVGRYRFTIEFEIRNASSSQIGANEYGVLVIDPPTGYSGESFLAEYLDSGMYTPTLMNKIHIPEQGLTYRHKLYVDGHTYKVVETK